MADLRMVLCDCHCVVYRRGTLSLLADDRFGEIPSRHRHSSGAEGLCSGQPKVVPRMGEETPAAVEAGSMTRRSSSCASAVEFRALSLHRARAPGSAPLFVFARQHATLVSPRRAGAPAKASSIGQ